VHLLHGYTAIRLFGCSAVRMMARRLTLAVCSRPRADFGCAGLSGRKLTLILLSSDVLYRPIPARTPASGTTGSSRRQLERLEPDDHPIEVIQYPS
jgi:hypothetical protein